MAYPFVIAYVSSEKGNNKYFLKATPTNIASFIVRNSPLDVIQITAPMDTPFISTCAGFIDYCTDQEFLRNELLPVLIPNDFNVLELVKGDVIHHSKDSLEAFKTECELQNGGMQMNQ